MKSKNGGATFKNSVANAIKSKQRAYGYPHQQVAARIGNEPSAMEAEVAALRAEVERLRADAERLDFIESRCRVDPKMDGNHVYWPTSFNHRLTGPNLRAAIDAARGGES